jgi:hypothetical protein
MNKMSLALATIDLSDFDFIYNHLLSHKPPYRNMHLRQTRQQNGRRLLRYLHTLHANRSAHDEIEGMMSGPEVFWHYRLRRGTRSVQLTLISENATPRELARIPERFLPEIRARIMQERAGGDHHPKRLRGQLYLRRRNPGMPSTHHNCVRAVEDDALDQAFVDQLLPWRFELVAP